MKAKKSSLTVIASVLFLIYFLFGILNYLFVIQNINVANNFLLPIGFLFFSLGLLISNNKVCIAGNAIVFLNYVLAVLSGYKPFSTLGFLTIALVLLVIAVVIHNKASLPLGILAAILILYPQLCYNAFLLTTNPSDLFNFLKKNGFGRLLQLTFVHPFSKYRLGEAWHFLTLGKPYAFIRVLAQEILPAYALPIAAILTGIGAGKNRAIVLSPIDSCTEEAIDRLVMLKEMLENGKITNQEFDCKKAQALEAIGIHPTLPLATDKSNSNNTNLSLPPNGWICANCGQSHYDYETSCACGKSRLDIIDESKLPPKNIDISQDTPVVEKAHIAYFEMDKTEKSKELDIGEIIKYLEDYRDTALL